MLPAYCQLNSELLIMAEQNFDHDETNKQWCDHCKNTKSQVTKFCLFIDTMEQYKSKKVWCDHHRHNDTHVTNDCYFLNKREAKMIKQVHRTALSHLRATFDIKQDSQDIIQPKNNKMWCDQHRYNDTHESKDCYFLNKKNKKTKEN